MRGPLYASRLPACCKGYPPYTARANAVSQELLQHYLVPIAGVMGMEGRKVLSTSMRRRHKGNTAAVFPITGDLPRTGE